MHHPEGFPGGTHRDSLCLPQQKGIPMSYTQLTVSERNQFYQLRTTTDRSMRAIEGKLGRSQSSLSRELARNQSS